MGFINRVTLTLALSLTISLPALAQLCQSWDMPVMLGELPRDDHFVEQSGFDISEQFSDRIYHISEAKKKLKLYITKKDGSSDKKVRLFNVEKGDLRADDIEDISTARCFGVNRDPKLNPSKDKRNCIFLGDIGGGKSKARNTLLLVILKEKKSYLSHEKPEKILRFKYPNKELHDAEAMAVHPKTGDLFILTKVLYLNRGKGFDKSSAGPAQLYKLAHKDWAYNITAKTPELKHFGEIDMDTLARHNVKKRYMHMAITAMDISSDGARFAFSTYRDLFEIDLDLSKASQQNLMNLSLKTNVSRIELEKSDRLIQQEAIAYDSNDNLLYSTEFIKGDPGNMDFLQPIMNIDCQKQLP